jgi:hypothetical protein
MQPTVRLTPPFSCPPAGATRAPARGVTAEWDGCNGLLGPVRRAAEPSPNRDLAHTCRCHRRSVDKGHVIVPA